MQQKVFEPMSCHLYKLACGAYSRCSKSNGGMAQPDAITAIILSVATLEGFINELTEYSDWHNPELDSLGDILSEAEEMHAQTKLKYLLAAHTIGEPFKKGALPYQDFDLLISLRHKLVHPKQLKPKIVRQVLARAGGGAVVDSAPWYGLICTTAVAKWACNTTSEMIQAILDRLPTGGNKETFEMMFCKWPDGQDCFQPVGK
jgi:hypothetical protein